MTGARYFGAIVTGTSLALAACGSATAPDAPAANAVQAAPETREAELAAIADRCGVPRETLQLRGNELALQPASGARFQAVDCVLREVTARGLSENLAMGFVGNELPGGNNVQDR